MLSTVNLIFILSMETLAVSCFLLGFILGKHNKPEHKVTKSETINIDDDMLDPISPEEQAMIKKLDEEARNHVRTEED